MLDIGKLPDVPLEEASAGERAQVASFIAAVTDWEGFAASVATKVLHKKRPKLILILDNEAIFGACTNPKWPEKLASTDCVTRRHVSRDDSDLLIHAFRKPLTCNKPEDRSRPVNLTVLGATGLIGTQLVEQALAAGHHVTALARSNSPVGHWPTAGV